MDTVRFGVVGLGNMGRFHADYMNSLQPAAKLGGACDVDDKRRKEIGEKYQVPVFATYQELINSGAVDAILIATPHYQHPEIALAAFERDIHVLSEKPLAVHVKDARKVIDAHKQKPNLTFSLVLQLRTVGLYKKIKEMITSGELGEISRVTWIVTDWFRTWSYYASGGWRATWKGEGGGVLINQCPHNLDMLQWLMGVQPSRVTAVASLGKTHPIEVEDEVSAILEYPNGAIGHFMTTTGEAPGTNRLEVVGDRGKLIAEGGSLTFHRTRKSVREVREQSPDAFVTMETWASDIPLLPGVLNDGHRTITQNFVNNILKKEPLIAPGEDGSKGLEVGNAMLRSGVTRKPVELPLDGDAYEQLLKDLDKQYGGKKTLQTRVVNADMATSFQRP
jgi:predicted dehydrogenase